MKHSSRLHADPPLLLSHSAASTSCESRLEEQATTRQLLQDNDDGWQPSGHQTRSRPPSIIGQLASNKDATLPRVLCPYHQLVAANVADPAALVAFPDENFCCRSGEEEEERGNDVEAGARPHEIDLIRDSLNDATARNSCDRHTAEQSRVPSSGGHLTLGGGELSRSVGRVTHVTLTDGQHEDTAAATSPAE